MREREILLFMSLRHELKILRYESLVRIGGVHRVERMLSGFLCFQLKDLVLEKCGSGGVGFA